jgi:hypothetical protein
MKQEWAVRQEVAMKAQPMSQNSPTTASSPMSYSSVTDGHNVWNTTAWPSQMELPQMMEQTQMMPPFQQDMQQFQQDQFQQAWNNLAMQQPELQSQSMSQPIDGAHIQMPQPQMQVQVPQIIVDSSSTELHRCMAVIMPETAQFPWDKNMVAAQLQAAADCQCYED